MILPDREMLRSVSIIVPNYNGRTVLEKYFQSIVRAAECSDQVRELIVVDDASTDDSVSYLRQEFPVVRILERERNGGFGEACNAGARAASGDILLFLMTDLEVTSDFVAPLVAHFSDPTVFAVGPRIITNAGGGENAGITRLVFSRGMFGIEWPGARPEYRGNGHAQEISFAIGGAMACDRARFLELGGFHPVFAPFCWEDVDLSYRARKRGWRVLAEPRSIVVHPEAHATIDRLPKSRKVGEIVRRNKLLFTWLNLHDRRLLALHGVWLVIKLLRWACRRDWASWRGFGMAIRRLPGVFRGREARRKEAKMTDRQLLGMVRDNESDV